MTARPRDRGEYDSEEEFDEWKTTDTSSTPMTIDVVDRLARRFKEDEAFGATLDEWVDANCTAFADSRSSSEGVDGNSHANSSDKELHLELTSLHEQFKALYERLLEEYISAEGVTVNDFYQQIRDSEEISNGQSSTALIGQILLATFDFEVFRVMMREAALTGSTGQHK